MVYDNLSTAVAHVGKGHERTLTDGFERFKEHDKFEMPFCNSVVGGEKGNVENKVGYERRNMFVPIPTILDFIEFYKELLYAVTKMVNVVITLKGILSIIYFKKSLMKC